MVVRGSACEAASWTSRSGTPALSGGDEGVAKGVRADRLDDPSTPGDPAHDPSGAVTVEAPAVTGDEDRACGTLADS